MLCRIERINRSDNISDRGRIQTFYSNSANGKMYNTVADSKEGWCDALTLGLSTWYAGKDIEFDFSLVRPAGARLKTMGGKASGPEPLRSLLEFARERS